MADPSAFFRWVLPYATMCPEPVAESHLVDAARDFCKRTRCWRAPVAITLTGDEVGIPVTPVGATLFELETATFDGRPLDPVSFAYADFADDGVPTAITQEGNMTVRLVPHAHAGELVLSTFLIPAVNADELPDFLLDLHGQDIANGALSTILALPNQPFSNPSLAAYYVRLFSEAKDAGFNIHRRGQQRAATRTRPHYF